MADQAAAKQELHELVARLLEDMETEGLAALERACRERPADANALRDRIDALGRHGLLPAAVTSAHAPDRLGDFELLRRIGGGGMGVVYLARQISLGRRVALKVVRPELLWFDGARERFRREVDAVARLAHPGIVPVHLLDDSGEVPYFAMEWIDGAGLDEVLGQLVSADPRSLDGGALAVALERTLHARQEASGEDAGDSPPVVLGDLGRGPWVDVAVRIALQAADAIEHAHSRGVVHRDLKPSNLMLTRDGRVRVVDFGLASTAGSSRLTRSGSQIGSLPYTSPEQLELGVSAVDARSDVYALGVTLYELLTLRPAFRDPETERMRRSILDAQVAPARVLNSAIAWDVETVCLTAMERDPARRYSSAATFAADLRALLERRSITARRPGPALRLLRFAQRRPAVMVGIVLGTLLLTGTPAVWAWQEQKKAQIALAAKQDLAAQLEQTQQALARAHTASRCTMEAVHTFLSRVADETLSRVPGSEQLRIDLLEKAVAVFEQVLREMPDEPALRMEATLQLFLLGQRYAAVGEDRKAKSTYDRAIAELESLRDDPGARELEVLVTRRMLASVLHLRGELLLLRDELDLAAADIEASVSIWRSVIPHFRDDLEPRQNLAATLNALATLQSRSGDFEAAVETYAEEVALAEELVAAQPDAVPYREILAIARANLGNTLGEAGGEDEAEVVMRNALVDYDEILDQDPDRPLARSGRATTYLNLGQMLARLDRREEAQERLRAALEEWNWLVDRFPATLDHHVGRATTSQSLADVLGPRQRDEALALLESAERDASPIATSGSDARAAEVLADVAATRQKLEVHD